MQFIRFADKKDLARIADCHKDAFSDSFSSKLGARYLEKMYEWYLVYPGGILLVAAVNGEVVGFIAAIKSDENGYHAGSASGMIQHTFYQAFGALLLRPWLLLDFKFLLNYKLVLKNVIRRILPSVKSKKVAVVTEKPDPYISVVSIAVYREFQDRFIGAFLLGKVLDLGKGAGIKLFKLSVNLGNKTVVAGYHRNGWRTTKVVGDSVELELRT